MYMYIKQSFLILDPPPIQIIKFLCRRFNETVHHLFCTNVSVNSNIFKRNKFGFNIGNVHCKCLRLSQRKIILITDEIL
jgi:hypothetical protein